MYHTLTDGFLLMKAKQALPPPGFKAFLNRFTDYEMTITALN
jgi:hypothetical protein